MKRAAGPEAPPIEVPRLSNEQLQQRVMGAPNFSDFQAANPPIPGYGAPYYEGNDLFSAFRDTGHAGFNQAMGGPSYNFNQYQSAPMMSAPGLLANPVTNMFTGTSGTGLGTALGAGAAGYLGGKAVQNFDLLRGALSSNGMTPGAQESVVGRQIAPAGVMGQNFNPSNLPAGTQVTFNPAGGGESRPFPGATPPLGAAAPRGRAPAGPTHSPRSVTQSLADRGFNPGGGQVVVQQPPTGPKGTAPAPQRFRVPAAGTKPTLRQALAPGFAGGVSSSGMRGYVPLLAGLGAAGLSMAPNLYNMFAGSGGPSPQVQTGAGTLNQPPQRTGLTAPIRSLVDADLLTSR
jgi:hypothetical protein